MELFLAIQNTYENVEVALFSDNDLIASMQKDKRHASKELIPVIHYLLSTNNFSHEQLSYIAVNQGPGPFTTLRTVIATVNGISFATNLPLIGINGLEALLQENIDPNYPHTVAILNAFNKDVYFGIQKNSTLEIGCKKIHLLLNELKETMPSGVIRFIGSATQMYKEEILEQLNSNAYIPDPLPQTSSIQQIAIMARDRWKKQKDISQQLSPIYLKQAL